MNWLAVKNNGGSVPLADIPVLGYAAFYDELCAMLADEKHHVVSYFAAPQGNELAFFCLVADDASGKVLLASHRYEYYSEDPLESITAQYAQMHPFEREIAELYGVRFAGNPWAKPLRFPHNRAAVSHTIENYPFYTIEGASLHEVNVGPIHAGVIEPGAFRFICNGEKVLHLEIALGYQHRGLETLMTSTDNRLRQTVLAESIAGDSVVAHTTAFATVAEKLTPDYRRNARLDAERAAALELERIAVHIADTGALCGDVAYQMGLVASEALRTIVINSTQLWCGNRFGKGLVRPCGTNFPLTDEVAQAVLKNIEDVRRRYAEVAEDLDTMPSLLSRFEDCGIVEREQLRQIGAVGVAARAGGLVRDLRATHAWGAYGDMHHEPVEKEAGDIMSRLEVRIGEVAQSAGYVGELLGRALATDTAPVKPDYGAKFAPDSLSFAMVEGWRGEVCHVALTDSDGRIDTYKIKDPSMHNWLALALSLRGEGISDFPICNKSFNLSYCGHDL